MRCKACGKDSTATLCNICFLEEVLQAVEEGEQSFSKILKRMVSKYGRLRGLKNLPAYRKIFGRQKIRRVITHAETGERCKLMPSLDGWIAVVERQLSKTGEPYKGEQSAEGGRIITYYEGEIPILEVHKATALVYPKLRGLKRTKYITSGPPTKHLKSPLAYKRAKSPLDKKD